MKFVCSKCRKLVDAEDIILDIKDVGDIRSGIITYCPACWDNRLSE